MSTEANQAEPRRKRRRYPIEKLTGGPQTIATDRGPIIIDTEHKGGQLLVRVEIPADDSPTNVDTALG